ncbi:MAG: ferritin-like domain-containing protein [Verrucomicrobiales bacterium]|nr:ferritin-like domain-containing protein [Verrucomicrobiales bacterium]
METDHRPLNSEEFARIATSIPDFQLGESSEGRTLRRLAGQFSDRFGLPEYSEAIDLFIREENRHASYLLRFMHQHGIPRERASLNNTAFHKVRKLLGIETILRTLVTGEIVALTYYSCLAKATESPVLQRICERILDEEDAHVSFQLQHIEFLNLQKSPTAAFLGDLLHFGLLNAALCAVWIRHHRVLRMRFSLFGFVRQANCDLSAAVHHGRKTALEMIDGRSRKIAFA